MPTSKYRNEIERASEQLNEDRNKIKYLWEQRVRNQIPVAEGQTSIALLNSMDIFLDDLIVSLRQSVASPIKNGIEKGMSRSHGRQRAKFAGYLLPQLLVEFQILREIVVGDLHEKDLFTFDIRSAIDRVFDSAISLATSEFVITQQEAIKDALQKAESSNKDLESFAAVAAHDLKAPLATIAGYLELLSDQSRNQLSKESLEYINNMVKASERMRTLIDSLLDYAGLTKKNNTFKDISVSDVVKSALQNLHDAIEKTHAQITFGIFPTVRGDFDLLIQLFQNLIANSIKFSGGICPMIHIDSESQEEVILFSLRDNGIGFDPKDKENIFSLYKKLHGEAEYPGSGIGLSTCRKVVEMHGGNIWAESMPDQGSTFFFTLPKVNSTDSITPNYLA